jgi:hypothetical protein
MGETQTKEVLSAILEVLKQQAIYIDRQHRWIVALGDTIALKTDLDEFLKKHPFYDLGPRPDLDRTLDILRIIDGLKKQLDQ